MLTGAFISGSYSNGFLWVEIIGASLEAHAALAIPEIT